MVFHTPHTYRVLFGVVRFRRNSICFWNAAAVIETLRSFEIQYFSLFGAQSIEPSARVCVCLCFFCFDIARWNTQRSRSWSSITLEIDCSSHKAIWVVQEHFTFVHSSVTARNSFGPQSITCVHLCAIRLCAAFGKWMNKFFRPRTNDSIQKCGCAHNWIAFNCKISFLH